MRSSMRSGLVVERSPAASSTSRQWRSGAAGASALQCASGKRREREAERGVGRRGSPWAAHTGRAMARVELDAGAQQQHVALERRQAEARRTTASSAGRLARVAGVGRLARRRGSSASSVAAMALGRDRRAERGHERALVGGRSSRLDGHASRRSSTCGPTNGAGAVEVERASAPSTWTRTRYVAGGDAGDRERRPSASAAARVGQERCRRRAPVSGQRVEQERDALVRPTPARRSRRVHRRRP